jgi:E3 ubiquitin-protein ligase RNF5
MAELAEAPRELNIAAVVAPQNEPQIPLDPPTLETRLSSSNDDGWKPPHSSSDDPKKSLAKKGSDTTDETEENVFFSCNICYELASEPVVTVCGHLYCWPCIYRWLQVQSQCRTCPVCKAGVERDKVIPIYGRGGSTVDPRAKSKGEEDDMKQIVPHRPHGQRPAPVMLRSNNNNNNNNNNGNIAGGGGMMNTTTGNTNNAQMNGQQGLGIIPTLFGLPNGAGQGGYAEPLTPEQQHQAFLSRLLLMLGSFVIMCLLLF